MRPDIVKKSKLLSLILRHNPAVVGVDLDAEGWIDVNVLAVAIQAHDPEFSRSVLDEIVASNDKRRFVLSNDGSLLRAAQGHSLGIDLGLPPADPPEKLFHGTAEGSVASISKEGLLPGKRDYVHLALDVETARGVGSRHGRPVVLVVATRQMVEEQHTFHLAQSGVWLTRVVPARYLRIWE